MRPPNVRTFTPIPSLSTPCPMSEERCDGPFQEGHKSSPLQWNVSFHRLSDRSRVMEGRRDDALGRLRQEAEVLQAGLESVAGNDALIVRGRSLVTGDVLAAGQPRLHIVGRAGVGLDN